MAAAFTHSLIGTEQSRAKIERAFAAERFETHRHAEETGKTKSLIGREKFQVPAHRLGAHINTKNHLDIRALSFLTIFKIAANLI
ncbi:MAG: hypothetical protein BWY75_03336 [bacterium ADurb.Bin425]|nr:MAG: hypothetical protein BWY75_03336 [bacterium ADurb.Bin425]